MKNNIFKSMKEKHSEKKEIKDEKIKAWNEHIRACAERNRIEQVKHVGEYLELKSIKKLGTIVFAQIFGEFKEAESGKRNWVVFYNSKGEKLELEEEKAPIEITELYRVLFKIIPFDVVWEDEYSPNGRSSDMEEIHLEDLAWNYGSNYDCDTAYSEKVPFSFDKENIDSSIKAPTDILIKKSELTYLDDKAIVYFSDIIQLWKENNFAEIVGDYNKWKKIKNKLLKYETEVLGEIEKRNLNNKNNAEQASYGDKGENSVEYALNWIPGYSSIRRKTNEKIYLLDRRVKNEKQEFDHIVVGENGVFLIETKYLKGNIKIDSFNNWIRTLDDGKTEGVVNPIQQVERHHLIASSILSDLVDENDIHDIVCLAYETCTVEGIENSVVPVVKSDMLNYYIKTKTSKRKYSENDIECIIKEIEKHRA